jgi:hypothetical protein
MFDQKEYDKKYREEHKECNKKRNKEYNKKNGAEHQLHHKYGITMKQKQQMIRKQSNQCSICGKELCTLLNDVSKACIDHNHTTGKIRGILCHSCNKGVGLLQDSPEILQNAINYLQEFN